MTEDTSPENLRKFLENDDPALVMMGLSMIKNIDIPETLNNTILEISMWNKDETIRKKASKFIVDKLPQFKKLLNSWTPSHSVLVNGGSTIEKVLQELIKLPNEYLDSKIKFLLQVPGKRNNMIKHLSNVDNEKVIDSFILIAKTSFGQNVVNFNGNVKSISSGYPSWSSWTCNDSKMTITVADLDRGEELSDALYPNRDSITNFLEIVEIFGERKKKKIIPILNDILSALTDAVRNLEYVGKRITKLNEEYGEGNYHSDSYEMGEYYLDIPAMHCKFPDGSYMPSFEWPPNGARCKKIISYIEKVKSKIEIRIDFDYPSIDIAPSARSKCLHTQEKIEKGDARIKVETVIELPYVGLKIVPGYVKPKNFKAYIKKFDVNKKYYWKGKAKQRSNPIGRSLDEIRGNYTHDYSWDKVLEIIKNDNNITDNILSDLK